MLLCIGQNRRNELVNSTMSLRHLEAIYRLIRQPIAERLGEQSEWIVMNDITLDSFDTVALTELPEKEFNLACQLILSNPNQDELIEPLIPELKVLFKQDSRFQVT